MNAKKSTFIRLFTRRRLIALAMLLLLFIGGWNALEYAVDIERYRPLLTEELTKVIGLPVTIGPMDLRLFPIPSLVADTFIIGQGSFMLEATSVSAHARLRNLIRKRLEITSINAQQAILTLPELDSDLEKSIADFAAHLDKDSGNKDKNAGEKSDSSGFQVEVEAISIARLQVRRGDQLAAQGTISSTQPFSDTPLVNLRASVPYLSENAALNASVRFTTKPGEPTRVKGTAALDNYRANALLSIPQWPELTATLRAEIDGPIPADIGFACRGDVTLNAPQNPLHGALSGNVWWRDGTLVINDATLEAPGLRAKADLTLPSGGELALRIVDLKAQPPALPILLAQLTPENPKVTPREEASAEFSQVLMGFPGDTEPVRFVEGTGAFTGFDLVAAENTRVFSGINGKLTFKEGALEFSELNSDGVQLAGTIRPDFAAGTAAVDVHGGLTLSREQLAAWLPLESVQELNGGLDITRLAGTFGPETFPPPDLKIETRLRDVSALLNVPGFAAPVDFDHVTGGVTWDKGSIQLDHLSGQGITVHGSLLRDAASGQVRLDLSGDIDLASPLLAMALPADTFKDLHGSAALQRVAGTFIPGEGMPADLAVEGAITNGAVTILMARQKEQAKDISARFTSTPEGIEGEVSLNSASLGPAKWNGVYTRASRDLTGTLWVNLDQAATPFLPPGEAQAYLSAVLRAYGQSGLDIKAQLPKAGAPGATVDVARQGEPALTAQAAFVPRNGQTVLDALHITADIPAQWLSQALPPRVAAEGMARFELHRNSGENQFAAELSLDKVGFTAGEYLSKREGAPAAVRVLGGTAKDPWNPAQIQIAVLGQQIAFVPQGERWAAGDLNIELAALTPLLPDGAQAGGRIGGSLSTNPVTAALRLDKARIALAPEIAIDSVEGMLAYRDGYWTCQNLRLLGAGSDCTMTAGFRGPTWHVDVNGAKLNLNALTAMSDAFTAFQENTAAAPPGEPAPAPAPETAPKPGWKRTITGDIAMNIQEVLYHRATIQDVRADIAIRPEDTSVDNLTMRLYSGALKGSMRWTPDAAAPGQMEVKATLENADMRILDELLFDETRAITGTVSGNVDLRFPYGKDAQPFNGLNGAVSFEAKDGSYGRMGFATKLLTLLKTTEIFRLKLPSFSDKGLTFTTSTGKMAVKDGVMALEQFTLTDKAYAIEAKGTVDFPQDTTKVEGRMHPLESVTGIVGGIPIIGDTLNLLKKTTGIPLYASGSPFDPTIGVEPGGKAGKEVKKAAESILKR